jgi:serine kinase of HPr protein (carbohydrate metabolism regulator)
MKRHVLIYGLVGGILITVLKWSEYRCLVIEHSIEIYGGRIAATFAVLGIWLGLKLTKTQQKTVVKEVPARQPFTPDQRKREELGTRRRELEILELNSPRYEQPCVNHRPSSALISKTVA